MIGAFDLPQIGRSPARFDFAKLENLNGHYMRQSADADLVAAIESLLPHVADGAELEARLTPELRGKADRSDAGPQGARQDADRADRRRALSLRRSTAGAGRQSGCAADARGARAARSDGGGLAAVEPWNAETTEQAVRAFAEGKGVKLGSVAQPLRAALTGPDHLAAHLRRPRGAWAKPRASAGSDDQAVLIAEPRVSWVPAQRSWTGRAPHLAAHTWIGYPTPGPFPADLTRLPPFRRGDGRGPPGGETEDLIMNSKTGASTKSGSLTRRQPELFISALRRDDRSRCHGHRQALPRGRHLHLRPRLHLDRSCESKITYIDGDEGILLYRGYPIEQLAEHGDFLETCYLLLYGELPTPSQKADFDYRVTHHTMVHEQMSRFFQGFRRDAHPMAVMTGCVGALSAFYHDSTDISDPHQRMVASIRMIAKMPTLAAMAYKYSIGQPFVYPKNDLDYATNFLRMCFAVPCEEYKPNAVLARAMDRIFILHADHEQNASTSTVRLAGSSGANPFACIAAGCACLWGPAHGGANEAALKMLREIGRVERIPEYVKRAKDKNDSFRLMGFGHRVYKNYDPRAKIMQKTCHEVLNELGIKDDPLLDVAMELERIALHDDYFIEKKLYPNIDFYSGITLKAMGFPTTMFTVLFAVARTVGWIAQWKEMIEDPDQKIGRPRQLYTGAGRRDYTPISRRK